MKVVIFGGAGGVGSTTAFSLLSSARTYEIVLIDSRPEMTTSHVMDLENVPPLSGNAGGVRAGRPEDALDADVVVVGASVPLRLNSGRSVFLAENARIVEQVLAPLRGPAFGGVVLLLTNPVNELLTWAFRSGWLPRERLVGYTLNDALRLRTGVARTLGVAQPEVRAWVLGEHGAGQVPLLSRISVAGERVELTPEQRADVLEYTGTWYARHVALDSGRTSTWASGLGAARMVEAIAAGDGTVLPAAVVLRGEYGVEDVALGVPVRLGPEGVREVLRWELDPRERRGMRDAAAAVDRSLAGFAGVQPGVRGS